MTNHTIVLFKSNFSLTDNYSPKTKYEKILNQINVGEKDFKGSHNLDGINNKQVFTSMATPAKYSKYPSSKQSEYTKYNSKEMV